MVVIVIVAVAGRVAVVVVLFPVVAVQLHHYSSNPKTVPLAVCC